MLKAVFHKNGGGFCGFEISGHAGYGTEGNDIVCAAVSSCTMLVCNAITDSFGADAKVAVEENRITLRLLKDERASVGLIEALYGHLTALAEDYGRIKVEID